MSATSWAACPRCTAEMRSTKAAKLQEVAAAYGKVAIEEFDRLRAEAEAMPTAQIYGKTTDEGGYSLREDYSGSCTIDEDTGIFYVSYLARCERCPFHFQFEVRENTGAVTQEASSHD